MDRELEQWIVDMKEEGWSDQEIIDSLVEDGYKRGFAMDAVREAERKGEENSFQPLDDEELEKSNKAGSDSSNFLPPGFFMDVLKFSVYAITALIFFYNIITIRIDVVFILFLSAIFYSTIRGRLHDVGLVLCIVYLLIELFFFLLAILL
ncbi:MAG: hypothetical protein SVV03_05150 [Candidatus Nanohaloarchaea archaeon]|nr:hypothetical protein [Candidatus Nanohaloarchaea archaeon]